MSAALTVETLARALYETDAGANGYPPLHTHIAWEDLEHQNDYRERARKILVRAAVQPPEGDDD